MGTKRQRFTMEDFYRIRDAILSLPDTPDDIDMSKKELVQKLLPAIELKLSQGHKIEKINEKFETNAAHMTRITLRNYVRDMHTEAKNAPNATSKPRKQRRKLQPETRVAPSDDHGCSTGSEETLTPQSDQT